jgi:ABC-2 type transport system permease protein
VTTFYFLSKFLDGRIVTSLNGYRGGYFPFVLIGLALSGYLRTALGSFSEAVRQEQMIGTLEAVLSTPTKPSAMVLCMSLWNFVSSSISVMVYFLSGILLFGLKFPHANILTALVVGILTVLAFSGIGILSASFIMVFKRGNPLPWFISSIFSLFGGVYFPITVLPKFLQFVSYFLPLTYSVEALRKALLKGYSLIDLVPDMFILIIFSIVLLPLSIFTFSLAVKKVKRDGTLAYY